MPDRKASEVKRAIYETEREVLRLLDVKHGHWCATCHRARMAVKGLIEEGKDD